MHIFESQYVMIAALVVCFLFLTAVGIYFAVRGIHTATGVAEDDFISIRKLERAYKKAGKLRENRCVLYISVSSEEFGSVSSEKKVFSELRRTLLRSFSGETNGAISLYGEKDFVAFAKWDTHCARKKAEDDWAELNKCLLKHSALNIVDVRIGAFFAVGTQVSFDEAIDRARQAGVLAKNGNLPYAEWNVSSGKALKQKIQIESNIENEIDNNRFFLEYQPVLDAVTKKIVGAEVLARLNSESDGVLNPGKFLSAVDSVGLNGKFDYYIFEKNCKWVAADKRRARYKYTINFSRTTLCDPAFAPRIISTAEKYGLPLSCLAVEVLEDKNVQGEDRARMISNLAALKEKGVSILLDDFGSGCTSFGDLQCLDISVVKLDKSLTQSAVTDAGFIVLRNIIRVSKDLGMRTLCEGIENEAQEAAAIRAGCDLLQGYYYHKPMPVAMLERVLAAE